MKSFDAMSCDQQPQRDDLAGEVLGVGEIALGALAVLLDLHALAVVLTVLREQDQRGRVGRLQRQHERQRGEAEGCVVESHGLWRERSSRRSRRCRRG